MSNTEPFSNTDLDKQNIPHHIAVIMDGNGRWARQRGLPRLEGHRRGYKTLKNIVIAAAELGVKALTVYTFSSENWTRPKAEVAGLMRLIRFAAKTELNDMNKEGVRIIASGRLHELPGSVRRQLEQDAEVTGGNSRIVLNVAVNYGGRNEIVDAVKKIATMATENQIDIDQIDDKMISSLMYRPELPDPDLLIRTAGEMRISNFLIWEMAYTEIFVTEKPWPDFSTEDLVEAIASYQRRTRKFGAVVEQK